MPKPPIWAICFTNTRIAARAKAAVLPVGRFESSGRQVQPESVVGALYRSVDRVGLLFIMPAMPARQSEVAASGKQPLPTPDDHFLISSILGGDDAALVKLMERYDRLVRYTVFRASPERCQRDPEWLESIASATWAGLVRSIRREPDAKPKSVQAYLTRIAKNQVASSLRAMRSEPISVPLQQENEALPITAELEEPVEELSRLELLEALRGCLTELAPSDRTLASQLGAITERRWQDAAAALGLKESTLRSRWSRTLERLRACIQRKTGESFAPSGSDGDR
jgi:RNA polymerase sigma factor (sigma-70 family)